jgi:hypothetical protein
VLSSTIHQELSRQHQADLARRAEHHRHVAMAKKEGSRGVNLGWASGVVDRITALGHPSRKPQPAL